MMFAKLVGGNIAPSNKRPVINKVQTPRKQASNQIQTKTNQNSNRNNNQRPNKNRNKYVNKSAQQEDSLINLVNKQ